MKFIDEKLLNSISGQAKVSPRLRMNYNFHEQLNDPVNRLLNAMEPGTYIRPHRHLHPEKEEIFLLLRGVAALFLFDDEGDIIYKTLFNPQEGKYGCEIESGVWHSLLVLEPGTVVYEVKKGPFAPLAPEDLAPWSPDAADKDGTASFMRFLSEQTDQL